MDMRFPDSFLWGASTSSHQVEGNNTNNDWWEWEQSGGTEPSNGACDHYHRFKDDFAIARELNHNSHRLGLEWSRLEKEEGVWDEKEWDHYKVVLDELIRLGIEPIITLNHFTLPLWLSHKGGWLNEKAPDYFARFAEKAVQEFGTLAKYWITINEPNILAVLAFYWGKWPPCHKSFDEMVLVLKHMIKAHVNAYILMHKNTFGIKVGIAKAVTAFHPCSSYSPLDRLSTALRRKFHNHLFIDSLIKGRILLPGVKPEKLPAKNTTDFIGLNYYFRQFIQGKHLYASKLFGEDCPVGHHAAPGGITDMGWEIYPEGLYEVVKSFSKHKLPIIITENGIATLDDSIRTKYIKDHLTQLLRAIKEKAPVIGYLFWSLLDNFEWADGYSKRFGLVGVDYDTQKRTIRDSARYYAQVIRTRSLD